MFSILTAYITTIIARTATTHVRINEIIKKKPRSDENRHNNNIINIRGGTSACKWHQRVSYVGNNISARRNYNNIYAKHRLGDTQDNILLLL